MMEPITRRRALQLGALGVGGTLVGGAGLVWVGTTTFEAEGGAPLSEPTSMHSKNGQLRVELKASEGTVRVAGKNAMAFSYNDSLPGPTLHLRPGDRLQIRLSNQLRDPTNLHVHGLHVSPEGNGDNIFITVDPGRSFDYAYQLPADHPPGVYWYHPHHHGMVADQIFAGLYGTIIVEEPKPVPVARERVLVISDITIDGSGRVKTASTGDRMMGREGELVLVNGQTLPTLTARPGERERWRIINACASRYLQLRLDGQQLQLLGMDSGHFESPRDVSEVLLAPANRADLLVTTSEGTASLQALPFSRGSMMGMMGGTAPSVATGATALATLAVTGKRSAPLPAVPRQPESRDLRGQPVARRRTLTFAMGMGGGMDMGMNGGMAFTIDGKKFDAKRVDHTVKAGSIEEWTIINSSPMDHPFHLHVWPMQLIEDNERDLSAPTWQDVVNIPANGQIKILTAFDDFSGRTVYHCHILDHEDLGMMGVVEAV